MEELPVAITFEPAHPIDNDEIAELSRRNPTLRFERTSKGALIVAPPTGSMTGIRNGELFRQLAEWNRRTKLGYAFDSSTGFTLPNGALYAADAAWIARDRWERLNPEEREGYAPLCPDVVFELRSKSDRIADLLHKLHEYREAGARLAVLVDPYQQTLDLLFPGEERRTHTKPVTQTFVSANGIDPLPGFALDLRLIF